VLSVECVGAVSVFRVLGGSSVLSAVFERAECVECVWS